MSNSVHKNPRILSTICCPPDGVYRWQILQMCRKAPAHRRAKHVVRKKIGKDAISIAIDMHSLENPY